MHCFYYRIGDDQNTNLQNWCPYGNYLFKEADYPVPKNVYTKEFLYLGCDITKDSSEVHLSKVCNKHKHCLKCATLPKTSGWKRKCLSIAGPDQSKVDIKAVPQVDETARKNVLQIAIHVFTALDDVDDFFRTVINELSKEQLTLISLFIGKKITSAVKFLLLNWKANTNKKKIISGTTTYTNPFLIPAQILSLI